MIDFDTFFQGYHLLLLFDEWEAKGKNLDGHTMQPRLISIAVPRIPCWKPTEQVQHFKVWCQGCRLF